MSRFQVLSFFCQSFLPKSSRCKQKQRKYFPIFSLSFFSQSFLLKSRSKSLLLRLKFATGLPNTILNLFNQSFLPKPRDLNKDNKNTFQYSPSPLEPTPHYQLIIFLTETVSKIQIQHFGDTCSKYSKSCQFTSLEMAHIIRVVPQTTKPILSASLLTSLPHRRIQTSSLWSFSMKSS